MPRVTPTPLFAVVYTSWGKFTKTFKLKATFLGNAQIAKSTSKAIRIKLKS